MQLNVVCLSLRRTVDRRARFDAQAHRVGLTFEYWDAPDAAELAPSALLSLADQEKAVMRFGRRLGLTEIACSEGHRQIYRRLIDSGDDAAIIFEDDVDLDTRVMEVVNAFRRFDREVGLRREVYLLGGREGYEDYPLMLRRRRPRAVTPDHSLVRVVRSDRALQRTCSYLITRSAAVSVLAQEPVVSTSADMWDLRLAEKTLEDVWLLEPPVAFHARMPDESLVQAERQALEAEMNRRRLAMGGVRRAIRIATNPRRLVTSLAYRLGWRRVKRLAYAWLSWAP